MFSLHSSYVVCGILIKRHQWTKTCSSSTLELCDCRCFANPLPALVLHADTASSSRHGAARQQFLRSPTLTTGHLMHDCMNEITRVDQLPLLPPSLLCPPRVHRSPPSSDRSSSSSPSPSPSVPMCTCATLGCVYVPWSRS